VDANVKALLEMGREKYQSRDFGSAEKLLEQVRLAAPGFADVHNMLGLIFHDQGKFGKALEAFQDALKINPAYTEARLNLAVTYNDLGMYAEARSVFAKAKTDNFAATGDIDPYVKGKLANMHSDLGDIYAGIQQFVPAIGEFRKALGLRPDFADIRTSLGKALREAGSKDDSLRELLEAKRLNPKYAPAGVQLGITYFSLGRNADAQTEWKNVLSYEPDNARATMFLKLVAEMDRAPGAAS
jgi:tetratricopeptide (TPR) repeat protein